MSDVASSFAPYSASPSAHGRLRQKLSASSLSSTVTRSSWDRSSEVSFLCPSPFLVGTDTWRLSPYVGLLARSQRQGLQCLQLVQTRWHLLVHGRMESPCHRRLRYRDGSATSGSHLQH